MLFMGERIRQVMRAYEEAVHHFSRFSDPQKRLVSLRSSAEVQQFYEIRDPDGDVSLVLRDSFFREQGPLDDLDIQLKISDTRSTMTERLPVNRLRPLGHLLCALRGDHQEREILSTLEERLGRDDADWAVTLFDRLKSSGFLENRSPASNYFLRPSSRPRVTLLAHSSLLLQTDKSTILVDPTIRFGHGLPRRAFDVVRLRLDALCCSHSHWDHCDVQTLLWFDKDIPFIIPNILRPSAFNPPMAPVLRLLGFTDIREVDHWEPVRIGDIEFVPVPFRGEQDEPEAEIDHYTYVLRTEGLSLYGGVDCYRDTSGPMHPVLERVRQAYSPTVAFLPVSRMTYEYRHGGVNGFCRYLDAGRLSQSFQYTASAEDAAEWLTVLGAKVVAPYAIFAFSRWGTPPVVDEFARALGRQRRGGCLYPLRPLDALDASDIAGAPLSRIRRRVLLTWFRAGAAVIRLDRRLRSRLPYRLLRRVASRFFATRPGEL